MPQELSWEADGLRYVGMAWGNPANPPVLALHGWLDNAASFARLAPLLEDYYVVAVDLSGHGRSSWRSTDATYQIYDDLPQLLAIIDQMDWPRCHLLGHSRGAIIATLFAACFPERVSRLVLLDGIVPEALADSDCVPQLRQFVEQRRRYLGRGTPGYPSVEKAVEVRAGHGLPAAAAALMVPRSLRHEAGSYRWTNDPRLRGASAMKLTGAQIDALLQTVESPTLLLVAEHGFLSHMAAELPVVLERTRDARVEQFPGGHHFHLEDGVDTLAASIRTFLQAR